MNNWKHGVDLESVGPYHPSMIYDAVTGDTIAQVYGIPINCSFADVSERYAEGMERARLIAAAPGLLKTLKADREEFEQCRADTVGTPSEQHFAQMVARCNAAIQQAKSK